MQSNTPIITKNTLVHKIVYNIMLVSILHSSFVAPAQELVYAYFNQQQGLRYKGFRSGEEEPPMVTEQVEKEGEEVLQKKHYNPFPEQGFSTEEAMTSDIKHGFIGVTDDNPLDDVSDNIFKVVLKDLPQKESRVFLSYELYGLQDYHGVTRSINDRVATGGHIIKKQTGWTLQREEIDAAWLQQGENRFTFGIPEGANLHYQVRNLRVEFEKNEIGSVLPSLAMANPTVHFIKDNKLYVKGFLRNLDPKDVRVSIEGTLLSLNEGEFEGFLELTEALKKRKFAVVRAVGPEGLVGQEIINFDNLMEADRLFTFEAYPERSALWLEARKGGVLQANGASIIVSDSALIEKKEISITHLRKVDVAPMASGMINVTKGGSAYRFLPDGIKFNRMVSISIGYDEQLIPKGYTPKDIKTFYFNTDSKSWIPVAKDTLNEKEKVVISLTDHFTDYINGIIQTPESPETAGFTPTIMSGIKAADPSSEITLISPPEVSQKGAANISYPIKIPSGRNGMQPELTLQYNSDGGSGWLGQGWSINIPAISMDTRWGVPEINNQFETVLYTLGGEQLMYPKITNNEGVNVDWMPHRQYDATSTMTSTSERPKITGAVFTPRKQGSFAKIERLGASPALYIWKVTNTDGTISWYGGKTGQGVNGVVENAVIKNAAGNIVYWALYMTEDVHLNTIRYSYLKETIPASQTEERAPLSSGIIYNIYKINYTGLNNSAFLYEIEFRRSAFAAPNLLRKDVAIDARLGVKLVDPCSLTNIFIRRTGAATNLRRYVFKLKDGEFQKSLLENVREFNSDNVEFYRHTFDYHNDVKDPVDGSVTLFDKPYFVSLPSLRSPSPNFSLGMGNILGSSALNTNEAIEAGWGVNFSGGVQFRLWQANNAPYGSLTANFPFGESFPKDKGYITMADINGDGLDDIIYKASSGLKYFASYRDEQSGKIMYEDNQRNIDGVTLFSRSQGRTKTMFLESHNLKVKMPFSNKEFFYGRFRTKSEIATDIFFADGNGDGLLDIVKDKMVLFNQADGTGRKFTASSAQTPNMLITASVNDIPDIVHPEDDSLTDAQGFDAVRVWIAPKSGKINIMDDLKLLSTNASSKIYYSIETSNPSIGNGLPFRLYLKQLTATNPDPLPFTITHYSGLDDPPLGSQSSSVLLVERGQKIFFRLTKNTTGINDEVVTNPTITYVDEPDANLLKDENLVDHTSSSFQDGFILSEDQTFEIADSGQLLITWDDIVTSSIVSNPNYISDGVLYSIMLITDAGEQEIYSSYIGARQNGVISATVNQSGQSFMTQNQEAIPYDIVVGGSKGKKQFIRFEVFSPSNLKWKGLQWKPRVEFIPTSPNSNALPKVKYPVAKYSIYKTNMLRKLAPVTGVWTTGSAPVSYGIKPNLVTLPPGDPGSFSMIVKKNGIIVGEKLISVDGSGTMHATNNPIVLSGAINLNTPSSQFYYSVGYYVTNRADEKVFQKYLTATGEKTAIIGYDWTASASSSKYLSILVESNFNNMEHLGPMHKEWGQFFYNDELDKSTTLSDTIGKLINPNIGDRYGALENAFEVAVDPNGDCFTNPNLTDQERSDCLANEYIEDLGLPPDQPAFPGGIDPASLDNIDLDHLILPYQEALVTPLLTTRATRSYPSQNGSAAEVEKWIGLFDTQYVMAAKMRSGSFAGSSFDTVFPDDESGYIEQADSITGMHAINKQRQSVSVTKTVGWGPVNLSRSNNGNYSYSTSDFIDLNGDGYPDLMSSEKVQFTRMTGGHRPMVNHSFGHLSSSSNYATRLVAQGGSQDLGRKEGPKTQTANSSLTEKTDNTQNTQNDAPAATPKDESATAKKDQGNPAFTMSIGADLNLDGENKEQALWVDLNGDGLPDKIVGDNGFKFRLNMGGTTANELLGYNMLNSSSNKPTSMGTNMTVGLNINTLFGAAPLPTGSQPGSDSQLPENINLVSLNIDFSAGISGSGSTTKTTLLDMNGDGLPDLLSVDEGEGNLYINNGNGFSSTAIPLKTTSASSFTMVEDSSTTSLSVAGEIGIYPVRYPICCWFLFFALPIIHIKGGISANGNASLSLTNSHKAFKDFNGDGYVDYVQKVGNNLEVFESKIARTNKLKTVTNPLKGSFTIDYKFQKTDYSNPHPKWVMSEVKVNDGYDKELKGQNTYVKRFVYENGRYDRRERSFYGYETVKAQNVVLGGSNGDELQEIVRTSVAKYHNSSYFLDGLLKESYVLQGDDETKKFSRTENFYKIRKLNDANTGILTTVLPDNFDEGGTFGRQSAAVVLANTKNYLYELSTTPLMTTNVSFIYDTLGRVVSSRNYGDLAVTTDDYTSTIAYHSGTALTAKHILNVPSSIIVTNQSSTQLRKRTTTVDDYGNILTVDAHHGGGLATTTMKYDTYGNLTENTLPPNEIGWSMFYKYTYDPTLFYKVIKIEDGLGLSSTVSYYLPTAPTNHYYYDNDKVIETTDWTGNKMQYTYDTSARMLTVRGPKEIAANIAHTIKFDYYFKRASLPSGNGMTSDADFVPVAVTSHYDPQYPTNFIETYTFIDGLGRPMQVKKDIERNFGTPQAPNYQEYLSISGWTSYDALGRAVTQKLPREEPKSNAQRFWINEAPALVAQTNLYDAIDRPIEVLDALNYPTNIAYSIGQDNFGNTALKTRTSVQQNNVQSIVSETYKDVNGRVVSTKNEGPNNDAIWTRFKYNAIGQLLAYIDAENKETSYDYDLLGRKIILKHPDNGKTSFIYDNASNLIRIQTANLENYNGYIRYTYDKNRLAEIIYPDTPSGSNISNVKYRYGAADLSGAETNQRGRLIWQQDATGEQEFKYGDMGEMIYNKRIIVGPNIPTRVFETRFEYDTWNRLKSMNYPDGENVRYTYDKGGNLKKITGQFNSQNYDYIKQIDYDHFEQRTYLKYGNNTETSYAYTPQLRRLNNLKVKTAAQQDLFNNTYQYDLVGNVTAVQNNAGVSSNNMGGTYSHNYAYDKLNRLSTANGVFNGSTAISNGNAYQSNYALAMDYNDTHGIKRKEQKHTLNNVGNSKNSYNNVYDYYEKTHRVKSILNQQGGILEYFTYDANGNMKTRGDMNKVYASYHWDESNRLRVVKDYRSLQHYLYDASGERILKAGSDSEAIYENGSLVNPSSVTLNSYTTYPSAFMVIDPNGVYSKHYYAGPQRIVSRLGDDKADIFNYKKSRAGRPASDGATEFDEKAVQQAQISDLQQYLDEAKLGKASFKEYRGTTYQEEEKALQEEALEDNPGLQRAPASTPIYFYHPDHLGTSTFLTDANGVAYQFFLNLPFGETMAEQHPDSYYRTPFKFSGKEMDEETGLHYFGARYYDSRSSIWLSMDPLAESFPNFNPYNYTMQNPINLVDPTGMYPEGTEGKPPKSKRSTEEGMTQGAINYAKKILAFGASLAIHPKATSKKALKGLAQKAGDLIHKDKGSIVNNAKRRVTNFVNESSQKVKNSKEPEFTQGAIMGELATGMLVDVALTKGLQGESLFNDALMTEASNVGQTVFRAVDATESEIIKSTGRFSLQEGGVEAKYFAKSLEDANWYGQRLYPDGYSIVPAKVNAPVNASQYWYPHVDIGAYVFPPETLTHITPQ